MTIFRHVFFALFCIVAITSKTSPIALADTYVSDDADILSEQFENEIGAALSTLDLETGTQIIVFTVSSLDGRPVEEVALSIARSLEIGQEDLDNGVLVLLAPNEGEVRIEVGRGLEGAITDFQAGVILREKMIPFFADKKYEEGLAAGLIDLEALARVENFPLKTDVNLDDFWSFELIVLFFGCAVWLLAILAATRSWWAGAPLGAIAGFAIGSSLVALAVGGVLGVLLDLILSKILAKHHGSAWAQAIHRHAKSGPSFWLGGSGKSGGSGSGGFRGGGGGFGGGGASGRF